MSFFNTSEDFLKKFGLDDIQIPNFETFKKTLIKSSSKEPILYAEWLKSKTFGDIRDNHDVWLKIIYDFFFDDPNALLRLWFDSHCKVNENTVFSDIYFKNTSIESVDGIIDGKHNSVSGRIIKNLFYSEVYYETKKVNSDNQTTINFWISFYKNLTIYEIGIFGPQSFDIFKDKRYLDFFAILRGTTDKASIFNPYAYWYILQRHIPQGEKLFCPVLSWCTPVIAYHNLHSYGHLVVCDVIDTVIDKSLLLNNELNSRKSFMFPQKLMDAYCCPSEKLRYAHDFDEKYKNYFDTVFFSPPYYNLELYPGENQSTDSFKTYEDWLNGYWRETVKLCYDVLKPGATFSFVIVPEYKDYTSERKDKTIPISKDMLGIAKEYFDFKETKNISWGGFTIKKQNHQKRQEVIEDIHILVKK